MEIKTKCVIKYKTKWWVLLRQNIDFGRFTQF